MRKHDLHPDAQDALAHHHVAARLVDVFNCVRYCMFMMLFVISLCVSLLVWFYLCLGLVDVVLLGLARGDEVAVLELHGLGALRPQLAADDDLAALGTVLL